MRLMMTTWELRKKHKIDNKKNEDSEYHEINRVPKVFNPLQIPKSKKF
jgi:hypothetical protein